MSAFLVCFVFCLLLWKRFSIILVLVEMIFVKFRENRERSRDVSGSRRFYCSITLPNSILDFSYCMTVILSRK